MKYEEYYGRETYREMLKTAEYLTALTDEWKSENTEEDLQPIVYTCYRIKKPESMIKKRKIRGLSPIPDGAEDGIYDGVGFRIICSFESDVHMVIRKLEQCDLFSVEQKKDYLSFPKPNGYRSIHLCVKMNNTGIPAEIQVRTIAMDCWATLEHQLRYKKNIADETLIKRELKRCADEIASTDLTMQTIREILKGAG